MNKIIQITVNYKFTILTVLVIIFLSLTGSENINTPGFFKFKNADKLWHFLMYGFLTIVYLMERTSFFQSKTKTKSSKWYFVLWIIITGAVIEIAQPIIAGREKDVWDFVANTAGVMLAYAVFLLLLRVYNFNSISSS